MGNWAKALAEATAVEAETLGEDIYFRGHKVSAQVGTTTETAEMEMAGYTQGETLAVVMPRVEYWEQTERPKINEILEARSNGYRIVQIRGMEAASGFELVCQLVLKKIFWCVFRY